MVVLSIAAQVFMLGAVLPFLSGVDALNKAQRLQMASHTVGINMAYLEAQRAGKLPADHASLFPGVAKWKQAGYTNMCQGLLNTLSPTDRQYVDMQNYGGYFEAGTSVLTTGPMAFTAAQQALGALNFFPLLNQNYPRNALGDSAQCLQGGYVQQTLAWNYLRQMRYLARSLSTAIVVSRADYSDFKMITGVADSSTFKNWHPSWLTGPENQEKCYLADMENPAADIAAQTATGLAMSALFANTHGTAADKQGAVVWAAKAERAYVYAKQMWQKHGKLATCSLSTANANCIGTGCTTVREDGGGKVSPPCQLYQNEKGPEQHLFAAAAAIYRLTGTPAFRKDADFFMDYNYGTFLYNWNNVLAQGIMILADAPDLPGATNSKAYYQTAMREVVTTWTNCSNSGVGKYDTIPEPYCLRTAGGSAYPIQMPWGNLGTTLNGVCAAALYNHYNFDGNSQLAIGSRCFMHRQLGYIFNHKCTTPGSSCNTPTPEGFSYMIGIGSYYPTKTHSRDAGYPNFDKTGPDGGILCGGIVSGPYAPGKKGRGGGVAQGTDVYTNDRHFWQESEPAMDYTSGAICALMGYAALPEGSFAGCNVRTAYTARPPPAV